MFYLLKKLNNLYDKLITKMENKENVFQCPYPNELYKSEMYKNMINETQQNKEIIFLYYMGR